MKDWTGNRRSTHATIGSFVGAHSVREEHDYYATDPSVLASLLNQKNCLMSYMSVLVEQDI